MIVTRGLGSPRSGSIIAYGYTIALISGFRNIIKFTLRIGQKLKFDLER